MTKHEVLRLSVRSFSFAAALALGVAGCKKAPIDDATLTNNVHAALTGDASIASEPIQPTVANGVVTLSGNVSNDTARLVAAQDAAKVAGVKMVVNNLAIQGLAITPTISTPEAPTVTRTATKQERQIIASHQTLPPPSSGPVNLPQQTSSQQSAPQQSYTPPPPPPAPVYRNITVPAGTGISVRINQTLDSGTSQEGATFTGIVTNSVVVDGDTVIPAGSSVTGRVVEVHEAGHYKGNSSLSVALTGVRRRGERIDVASEPYTLEGKGRGKNTAAKVGGGAAVGAILGGIFGGGKGAAIGAGVGAGAGGVANGVTRGEQVQITSESVIRFRLANSFSVRSLGHSDEDNDRNDRNDRNDGLQRRPE